MSALSRVNNGGIFYYQDIVVKKNIGKMPVNSSSLTVGDNSLIIKIYSLDPLGNETRQRKEVWFWPNIKKLNGSGRLNGVVIDD
jgi:hypothetical protein